MDSFYLHHSGFVVTCFFMSKNACYLSLYGFLLLILSSGLFVLHVNYFFLSSPSMASLASLVTLAHLSLPGLVKEKACSALTSQGIAVRFHVLDCSLAYCTLWWRLQCRRSAGFGSSSLE